jgi:hypothetical protein
MIIMHDSNRDWDHAYQYSTIVANWKFTHNFEKLYPNTLILTNDEGIFLKIMKFFSS